MMETETEEPPVVPASTKVGSIPKEKKKKLKAVFRKRHHGLGNLSIRNSTLNSTVFKTSLKINNKALAQALEKKKSECRAAEAIILQQKEQIQLLTTELNKGKMMDEKPKRIIQERLQAVSSTMQLAVQQLFEAMDACTDGELRKLSGHLLPPSTSAPVLPSLNEQISPKPVSNVVVRPVAGPSRVTVSAAAAAAACDEDDDDDEDQDVIASMDLSKELPSSDVPNVPPVTSANLSIIMEQSYLVPSETDFTYDEPVFRCGRSNSRDRRNMVVFQPPVDSPTPGDMERAKQDVCVRGPTRSRSRQFDLPTGEMDMLLSVDRMDAGTARSKSRDRRNAMIFHPSSAESPEEARVSSGNCVRILRRSRNRSGQSLDASAVKLSRFEDSKASSDESTKFKVTAVPTEANPIFGREEVEQASSLDETLVSETEVLSSDLVGQLGLLRSHAKSSKIDEGSAAADFSMDLVDETILIPYEESSCVMEMDLSRKSVGEEKKANLTEISEAVHKHAKQVNEGLPASKISCGLKQGTAFPAFASTEEADGLVNRGQFVTRDKITRTPVKDAKRPHGGEDVFHQNGDLSDILDRESDESEYRRSRSLSRRDIPTFLPIDSPNAGDTSPGTSKRRVSVTKGPAKGSKFLKAKGTRINGAGPSELKEIKNLKIPGGLISRQGTVSKSGVSADKKSSDNSGLSRRRTFEIPDSDIHFFEADIMQEDDSVLINETFESCRGSENEVFVDAVQPPGDDGIETGSGQLASRPVELPNVVPIQAALSEKNATILMAEDMEQTGVSFSAISIIDPPLGIRQLVDGDANAIGEIGGNCKVLIGNSNSPKKQPVSLDELDKKKSVSEESCSESIRSKTAGRNHKVNNREAEKETRDESAENNVEQTNNAVKHRRVAHSKLKLPGSGIAIVEALREKDVRSERDVAATKRDKPVQSRKRAETESDVEESHEQSMDIEAKKRFAAYLSKPGNIVFNADRKDAAGSEVAKPSRSKSRSTLPLQQKPRSKASATSARSEDEGAPSVWDFKGTPRLAAAKETTDRLLSVYDISLNDSGVIPKPKSDAADPVQKKRSKALNEFSKDDSFIVDRKPPAGKRRVRHESASAVTSSLASESENVPKRALVSPHGIMLALGNGKRRKPSARSKTVRYDLENAGVNKVDNDPMKTSSSLSEIDKNAAAAVGSQPALKKVDTTTDSNLPSKLKPAGAEIAVAVESVNEHSTQKAMQLEINKDKLVVNVANNKSAEENAEKVSVKDVRLDCEKSQGDDQGHSVKGLDNPERHNSKEIVQRNRTGRGTSKNTDNVVAANAKDAVDDVKDRDVGKRGQSSASAKGRGLVNPRKGIQKDSTDPIKGSKNIDSKDNADLLLCKDDEVKSDIASSQALQNFDDDEPTVLYAKEVQTLESDVAAKSHAVSSTSRKLNEAEQVVRKQKLASLHIGNTEQQNEVDSPRPAAGQRNARKRRVVQSTDLFEDIDTPSLYSPKAKQPALAEEEQHPVTSAGTTKALHKHDNHRQQHDVPITRRSQSGVELPKPPGPGNARKDHNSLRLRKHPKATSTKAPESSNVPAMAELRDVLVIRQLVCDQPLGTAEKRSDAKKKSFEKESPAPPSRRHTNQSIKNAKEKANQRKGNLPKEECILVATNNNLVETHNKDFDLQDDASNDGKLKKKRSVIQSRQSSVSTGSCDMSSHAETADRRTRRNAAQAVSYKEPSLGKKLRRGDPHTSTIYGGSDPDLAKHHDSDRTSDARLSRKVLTTVENTSMETE